MEIELIRKIGAFRKDDRISEIISKRDQFSGLVHILPKPRSYRTKSGLKATETQIRINDTTAGHAYVYLLFLS